MEGVGKGVYGSDDVFIQVKARRSGPPFGSTQSVGFLSKSVNFDPQILETVKTVLHSLKLRCNRFCGIT